MKGTEAMDHVRDEMAKSKCSYIACMGEMMTAWLRMHPDAEMDAKKTIKGAFDALKKAAKAKAVDGCYGMPPNEVFEGMMEYYGIKPDGGDFAEVMQAMYGNGSHEAEPVHAEKQESLELDLDALLGGLIG